MREDSQIVSSTRIKPRIGDECHLKGRRTFYLHIPTVLFLRAHTPNKSQRLGYK